MTASFHHSTDQFDALRNGLRLTARLLKQRQACDIPAGYINAYVGLDWLEWTGGNLRLTTTGENICRHVTVSHRSHGR